MCPSKRVPVKSLRPSTQVAEDCGRVIFLMSERKKETGYKLPKETEEGVLRGSIGKVTRILAELGGKK